ncbi:MAG TPA: XrtA/PEP-CTERM system histidine kinase PrsK, partial [Gammaproteobacteria bacterium]|nr:XrtA/PEP-CTERM system histidine kinase PrsK [Gammaproteobacteria bacterium]
MIFAVLSYAAAGLAYGILGLLLALSRQGAAEGRWLLAVVGGMSIWAWLMAALALLSGGNVLFIAYVADAARGFLWTFSLLSMLPGGAWQGARRGLSAGAGLLVVAAVALPFVGGGGYSPLVVLGSSILVCLAIEQVFRNSGRQEKRVLVPLVAGVVGVFAYDLFVFADAVLLNSIEPRFWAARGLVAAIAVPFLLIFAKRHPDWTKSLFVSRHVVFYSTTVTGVGLYLVAMAVVGFLIRREGGEWGGVLHLAFSVAALGVLLFVLSSSRLRAAGRMFLTKHFYRNQYEYRDEWLRLIRTLSASSSEMPLDQRAIVALADIVASPGGQLWLRRDAAGAYEPFAARNAPFPDKEYASDAPIVRFLAEQGWVIDSEEYAQDPDLYNHAFRDAPDDLPPSSFIVPLFHRDGMLGLARLVRPEKHRALNFEDHDLLKTAGRQVAAFLAHDLAMEQLAEASQFEAYSKLSAFVIHDLKNLLAQQALLVENAKKFQHRPEFVADVVKTVDNGVQRMRRLLRQLERDSGEREHRIELSSVVKEAVDACSKGRGVMPSFNGVSPIWVHAPSDRLASVVGHIIANAQDATGAGGAITVTVAEADSKALIEVRDTGAGMTEEFIRKRLFKPFDTTKGMAGMGVGVYQAREIVR